MALDFKWKFQATAHLVEQIGPVEGSLEDEDVVQVEDLFDVGGDAGRGRGRQSHDGHAAEERLHHAQKFVICAQRTSIHRH